MDMYNYLAKLLRVYNTDDLHNFVPVNINSIAYITKTIETSKMPDISTGTSLMESCL